MQSKQRGRQSWGGGGMMMGRTEAVMGGVDGKGGV